MGADSKTERIRLAELLGGLSLACDYADGFPPEKVLRTVVLATRLAQLHGLSADDVRDVYYVTLLRYLGCTGFAHEESHEYSGGDDLALRRTMALADPTQPLATVTRIVRGVGASGEIARSVRAVARLLGDGVAVRRHAAAQCETSIQMAKVMRLGERVQTALAQVCERWDGKGEPSHRTAEALDIVTRVHHVADVVELVHAWSGRDAALAEAKTRAGGHFDPVLARTFEREASTLFAAIEAPGIFEAFLESEPAPRVVAEDARVEDVIAAFASFADLKSVFTLGHSVGVAAIAERTARALGAGTDEVALVRRAALLHDLGRVGVANVVWDKPAPLGALEWERVRLHAYYTERILWHVPSLRPVANVAAAAHERLDGGGYHRSLPAAVAGRAARILAAADVHHALREPRPHRPARGREETRRIVLDEARAGRLDAAVVRAMIELDSGDAPRRAAWPAGLSDREVEVLRLVARGKTNKEIAAALDLSPKTVQHHVAHCYEKIGVRSRAAAALFATDTGLLAPH